MIDTFNFSTRDCDPSERFGRYRDFYSNGSDAIELGSPVAAEIQAWRLGGMILFERRLAGLGTERLAPRIRRAQFDHFTVQLNLRGEFHAEGSDGFKAVRPGEILLLDMAKPMRTRMPDVHLVTLSIARAAIESAGAATDRLHGLVIPAERGAPLARFLAPGRAEAVSSADPSSASAFVAELLGSALSQMGLAKAAALEDAVDARLGAARRYILEHLGDEALCPARVARAANLSRATLYRLFEQAGGVQKYIQAQRLAQLKRSLSDPCERQSVMALAYDAGFASEQHASRAFRQEFGLPPAEFRRDVRLSGHSKYGGQAGVLKQKMIAWFSDLGRSPGHAASGAPALTRAA